MDPLNISLSSLSEPESYKPIQVVKRSGRTENVSFDKITRRIAFLLKGDDYGGGHEMDLSDKIDPAIITQKIASRIVDGISTTEIDIMSANICISMSINNYYYGILAGRIVIDNHKKNTESCILRLTKMLYNNIDTTGKHNPLISDEYYGFIKENYEELNKMLDFSRDFNLNFFGFKTLEKAYLHKIREARGRDVIIERPQHLWLRVAIQIHMKKRDPSTEGISERMTKIKETYDFLSNGYFTHATPTLYHSGGKYPQLASCFLMGLDDSMEEITDCVRKCAQISKWAGGIGLNLPLRSDGTIIRSTNGKSSGIVPWLIMMNSVAKYVNQSGKRYGSFAVYIEMHHPDIIDFIQARRERGPEGRRAKDLFYGLWISDYFMECVEHDRDWYLLDPNECPGLDNVYGEEYVTLYNGYVSQKKFAKKLKAMDIWKEMFISQVETGMPYMCYKDAVNRKSNQKNIGVIKNSNLCVSGDTMILTDKGYFPIAELEGENVRVWNGKNFSDTVVLKTGENIEMCKVSFNNGMNLVCTDYHRFYVRDPIKAGGPNSEIIKKANELSKGDTLIDYSLPIIENTLSITHPYVRGVFMTSHGYFLIDCKNDTSYASRYPKENSSENGESSGIRKIKVEYCKNSLAEKLEELGLQSNKKINIKIYTLSNDIDNTIPVNAKLCDKLQWVSGFLDGSDVYEHSGMIFIDSGNCIFHKQIILLLSTLGIRAFIRKNYISFSMVDYIILKKMGMVHSGSMLNHPRVPKTIDMSENIKVVSIQKGYLTGDTFCFNEPEEHKGIFNGILTGNCTEIMEYSDTREVAVCNLASIALNKFIIHQDLEQLRKSDIVVYTIPNCEYCLLAKCLLDQYDIGYNTLQIETEDSRKKFKEENDTKTWPQISVNGNLIGGYSNLKEIILPTVDYDLLVQVSGMITENLNNIIDINYYPIPEAKLSNLRHRPIGIGVQGLADLFAILEIPYEREPGKVSDEAREINSKIFESIYYGALRKSVELAKRDGPYETFNGSPASKGILQFDMWKEERESKGQTFDIIPMWDFDTLKEDIVKYGLRNSLLVAPMPTASTSQILGNMECFEPFTSNIFKRTTIAGDFPVVNQHLVKKLHFMGLYNNAVITKIIKDEGSIQNITEIPREIRHIYKTVWEISQKVLIDLAADRSVWIDQSASLNLYVKNPILSVVSSMHFYAWKKGLKTGLYYLRSKSAANAQQFSIEPEKGKIEEKGCDSCSA
jgi:ribonucleoside-diphosphate reductase alpha chain